MYRVTWRPTALNRLADVWAGSSDRGAIDAAVDEIDRALRRDPEHEGESRDQGRRILIAPPLGVFYRVSPQDREVLVLTIWRIDRNRQGS